MQLIQVKILSLAPFSFFCVHCLLHKKIFFLTDVKLRVSSVVFRALQDFDIFVIFESWTLILLWNDFQCLRCVDFQNL